MELSHFCVLQGEVEGVQLNELQRLSYVVAQIDNDTDVVPVHSFLLSAKNDIIRNAR